MICPPKENVKHPNQGFKGHEKAVINFEYLYFQALPRTYM